MKNIPTIVQAIIDSLDTINGYYGLHLPKGAPHPPASQEDLNALDNHLRQRGIPLPPSYRSFLATHNGIDNFYSGLNLLSAREVMLPVDPSLGCDFPTLSRFVIALGNTSAFISLDPETADKSGEMEVVWTMADGGQFRYPDFGAFLETLRDELQKTLAKEQADRKGLLD